MRQWNASHYPDPLCDKMYIRLLCLAALQDWYFSKVFGAVSFHRHLQQLQKILYISCDSFVAAHFAARINTGTFYCLREVRLARCFSSTAYLSVATSSQSRMAMASLSTCHSHTAGTRLVFSFMQSILHKYKLAKE